MGELESVPIADLETKGTKIVRLHGNEEVVRRELCGLIRKLFDIKPGWIDENSFDSKRDALLKHSEILALAVRRNIVREL